MVEGEHMKLNLVRNDYVDELITTLNQRRPSSSLSKLMLTSSDLLSMAVSITMAFGVFEWMTPEIEPPGQRFLEPLLVLFAAMYFLSGHHQSRNVNPVEELRSLTVTTTIIFATLFAFNTLLVESKYPAAVLAFGWLISVGAVPLARLAVRRLGSKFGIWGEPVVVIGNGLVSRKLVQFLLKNPYCGMRPVLVVDGLPPYEQPTIPLSNALPIPVTSLASPSMPQFGSHVGATTAIIVAPDLPASVSEAIARGEHFGFSNIITVTNPFNTRNFDLKPLDFGGMLGFEERHYELDIVEDRLIRVMDLLLIFIALPLLVPIFLTIILAIRLDTGGSAFYRQTRIGKSGKTFKVLKFRTMVENADKVLKKYLEENPEMLAEWNADQKLRNDPRITRTGRILRKTSLDELPQLWNVLKGEMSLVGPRPIVADEIDRYGDKFKYYAQVPPGLSGLWQVSGRNDVDYEQRVGLDEYYVRNRSIWMNLHIIIRTFLVVLKRDGAY